MKSLQEYINESELKTSLSTNKVQPKTKDELKEIIKDTFEHKQYDLNFINTSEITDMSKLFMNCKYDFNISDWDVANVTDMNHMFFSCKNFDIKCFESWNVSNVTNMTSMFAFCNKFDCDLSNWNVSNVTCMYFMFGHCKQFNCDLSQWNVSKVKDMKDMFIGCSSLTIPDWYKK